MENVSADFTINDNNSLQAEFTLGNSQHFDCSFELFASGTVWGSIDGDISNQTDLYNILSTHEGQITSNHNEITSIHNTIQSYGDIVTYNAASFATSAQGALANTALQPGDNISELNNNVGYTTNAGTVTSVNNIEPDVNGNVTLIIPDTATWGNITGILSNQTDLQSALNSKYDVSNPNGFISGIDSSNVVNALGYTPYNSSNPSGYITSADLPTLQDLTTQTQLDAINSGATSAKINQIATNTSDISSLNSALQTETTNRQNADNNLQSQIDAITASSDVTDIVGTYAQLQAYDTSTLAPNSIIKVLQDESQNDETTYYRWVVTGGVGSWVLIGEEGPYYTKSEADDRFVPQTRTVNGKALSNNIILDANDVGALPDNTTIPTATSELTNDSGFITGIDSADVVNALGYTPYNNSNPNGYTSNVGTVTSVNNTQPDSNGNVTIPTGGTVDQTFDGTSANAQSGVAINGAGFLQNNASAQSEALAVGQYSTSGNGGVALGYRATVASGNYYGVAIGDNAVANEGIQIGSGTNSTYNTLQIRNYALFNYGTGFILDDRLSNNIVRISALTDGSISPEFDDTVTIGGVTLNYNVTDDVLYSSSGIGASYLKFGDDYSLFLETNDFIIGDTGGADEIRFLATGGISVNTTGSGKLFTYNGVKVATINDIPSTTNFVTTNTAQNISGRKTFLGEKAIYFKQNAATNKLGFTLYSPNNTELGALEYRPNTINGGALLSLNEPIANSDYVGFRYWGTNASNIIAPKPSTGGDYYIPVNITDGTTTVTANSTGAINISSLFPSSADLTLSNVTSISNSSAVKTALDEKVNKSGDTMTGGLNLKFSDLDLSSTVSSNVYQGIEILDTNSYRVGRVEGFQKTDGSYGVSIGTKVYGSTTYPKLDIWIDSSDVAHSSFPKTTCCDGQWVAASADIFTDVSPSGSGVNTYSLSNYLPNDNYAYECLFVCSGETGATSGNYGVCYIGTTLTSGNYVCMGRANARSSAFYSYGGASVIPVGADRKIYYQKGSSYTGKNTLSVKAYRRIGTNS